MKPASLLLKIAMILACALFAAWETPEGSPVRFTGQGPVNLDRHDGGLPPAVGVHNYQVLRANREHPEWSNGTGWTYNHAPVLAFWRGRFYLEFLSAPVHEEQPPMHAQLVTSKDGRTWSFPSTVFPAYLLPNGRLATFHHRMGFYAARNGRLLVLTFVGGPGTKDRPSANDGNGVGRLVREIREDGTFGPIYFIRLNTHRGWASANVNYPLYTESGESGFREACEELLANRLYREQWWEEDRAADGFYAVEYPAAGLKAMSWWHASDGKVIAGWKWRYFAESADEGKSWSKPAISDSVITNGAKVWGQKTGTGYVLLYNPTEDNLHRWPLAITTGKDGRSFSDMGVVQGEVPPQRYAGLNRESGPQYVRGIEEGNGKPPGPFTWIAYSMSKEDLWIARIPETVETRAAEHIQEDFEGSAPGEPPARWNVYSPLWAPVRVARTPLRRGLSLELTDSDPADYSKAVRVFPESQELEISFDLLVDGSGTQPLHVQILARNGQAPVRLQLGGPDGIAAMDGTKPVRFAGLTQRAWHRLTIAIHCGEGSYDLLLEGNPLARKLAFAESAGQVERIEWQTGPPRTLPTTKSKPYGTADLPGAGERVPAVSFFVDNVVSKGAGKRNGGAGR